MLVRFCKLLKAESPMVSGTVLGEAKVALEIAVPMNAELPMTSTLVGIAIDSRGSQANADSPIVCSVLGEANVTEKREFEFSNAPAPMDVTLAGIRMLVSELASWNA